MRRGSRYSLKWAGDPPRFRKGAPLAPHRRARDLILSMAGSSNRVRGEVAALNPLQIGIALFQSGIGDYAGMILKAGGHSLRSCRPSWRQAKDAKSARNFQIPNRNQCTRVDLAFAALRKVGFRVGVRRHFSGRHGCLVRRGVLLRLFRQSATITTKTTCPSVAHASATASRWP